MMGSTLFGAVLVLCGMNVLLVQTKDGGALGMVRDDDDHSHNTTRSSSSGGSRQKPSWFGWLVGSVGSVGWLCL